MPLAGRYYWSRRCFWQKMGFFPRNSDRKGSRFSGVLISLSVTSTMFSVGRDHRFCCESHVHRQPLIQQLYCTFRCNDDLWTQLSAVVPFPPSLQIFNSPVRPFFHTKRRIWLFQLVNLLRFRKFKTLGVAAK